MDYFWLRKDRRIQRCVRVSALTKEELAAMEPMVKQVRILEGREETIFPDYLTTHTIRGQYHLISDRMKQLLRFYLPQQEDWTPVVLIDQFESSYLYWFLTVEATVGILSEQTKYERDRTIGTLVLTKKRLPDQAILSAQTQLQSVVIVRLDAAESILRRGFYGIHLERVRMEG